MVLAGCSNGDTNLVSEAAPLIDDSEQTVAEQPALDDPVASTASTISSTSTTGSALTTAATATTAKATEATATEVPIAASKTTSTATEAVSTSSPPDRYGAIDPPAKVAVILDGPDVVISWTPAKSAGPDIEYLTHIRPIGDAPDFRPFNFLHANHLRVDRLNDVPHGEFEIETWAARVNRDGDDYKILAESPKVLRNIVVNEAGAVALQSVAVSDLLFDELNNHEYIQLSLTANKCVFVEVTGATQLRQPAFYTETCFSDLQVELDPLPPGAHTITVVATDRKGNQTTQTVPFTIDGSKREPCRVGDPLPDPWRVKAGTQTTLTINLAGDCGEVDWQYSDWAYPGFSLSDGVLTANPAGPPRGEVIDISIVPTLSEGIYISLNVIVYTDDDPDVVPCTLERDESLIVNGELTLNVALGQSVSTKLIAVGDCDPYEWQQQPALMEGVTFDDGLLTISGQGEPRTMQFAISLLPENGTSWGQFVVVNVTG